MKRRRPESQRWRSVRQADTLAFLARKLFDNISTRRCESAGVFFGRLVSITRPGWCSGGYPGTSDRDQFRNSHAQRRNQGIGFAVPLNLCRWVMDNLVKYGHVNRGFLGVEIQNVTPGLAQAFKLSDTQGALVSTVTPGSAAAEAGLQSGDVIVQFNSQPIQDASQLKLRVAETGPGVMVPVEVMRNGEKKTFSVTLKEQPNNEMASANSQNSTNRDALQGVVVADLDQQTRSELNIPANVQGALITEVDPASPSYEAGLRSRNVILEINHQPLKNAEEAVRDTAKPVGNETLVKIGAKGVFVI